MIVNFAQKILNRFVNKFYILDIWEHRIQVNKLSKELKLLQKLLIAILEIYNLIIFINNFRVSEKMYMGTILNLKVREVHGDQTLPYKIYKQEEEWC